jgi:hypothetical protein
VVYHTAYGKVAEWLKAPLLKSGDPCGPGVRIPPFPPNRGDVAEWFMAALSKSAGPLGPEVRILPSPPKRGQHTAQWSKRRGLSIGELSALLRRGPLTGPGGSNPSPSARFHPITHMERWANGKAAIWRTATALRASAGSNPALSATDVTFSLAEEGLAEAMPGTVLDCWSARARGFQSLPFRHRKCLRGERDFLVTQTALFPVVSAVPGLACMKGDQNLVSPLEMVDHRSERTAVGSHCAGSGSPLRMKGASHG